RRPATRPAPLRRSVGIPCAVRRNDVQHRDVLHVAPKGQTDAALALSAREDALLRAAFGRYGGSVLARRAAAAIVQHHQQIGAGRWILCDCRPDAPRPPVLVPVAQHHIRRHEDASWPAHAEACDFYRDPDEQRVITASYAVPIEREWRLSRPLVGEALQPQLRVQRLSCHVARPRLARLLLHLVTEAGLQRIGEDAAVPDFPEQVQALWTAAGSVNLDVKASLRHFLCTSVARMPVLIERLEQVRPGRFVHNRPHGILIVRLAGIAEGALFPLAGDPIAVRGRVAVFGENPERCRAASLRPPLYLAACVVARAAADAAVEKLWGDRRGEGILAGVTNPSGVPDAPFKRPQPIPRPLRLRRHRLRGGRTESEDVAGRRYRPRDQPAPGEEDQPGRTSIDATAASLARRSLQGRSYNHAHRCRLRGRPRRL